MRKLDKTDVPTLVKLGSILKSKRFLAVAFFLGLLFCTSPKTFVDGRQDREVITFFGIVMMIVSGYLFFWKLEKNPPFLAHKSKPFLAVVFFLGLYLLMAAAGPLDWALPEEALTFFGIVTMMVSGYFFWKLEKKS
jgi:hypothetical protein